MFSGKPIIGIAGGIGSGKSTIASLFGDMGCLVINSDQMARDAYKDPTVRSTLKQWWGKLVFDPSGEVDRSTVARKIFNSPSEKQRLERLIHPIVNDRREKLMKAAAEDPNIVAFVWDTPLLFETELNKLCDAVVFVDVPQELRLSRVASRGWNADELARRENSQLPLDKKREISDYVLTNTAGVGEAREQVRAVLSQILAAKKMAR